MAGQNASRDTQRRRTVAAPARPPRDPLSGTPGARAAVPGAGPVRAVRLQRGAAESVLRLDESERYVLGRHDAAEIAFDAAEVSRLHGVLRFSPFSEGGDGAWSYEDLGSQNGTTLVRADGIVEVKPHAPVRLAAFDTLELGGESARLELLPESELDDGGGASDERGTEVSRAARAFAEKVRLAAKTRVPVFLLGPSGVGKTFTARQIHDASGAPGPFVAVNCARLPQDANALHSELLGHVRGAYTGAEAARTGKLVFADAGTLFLDEVESLPPLAQGFLLDVLEATGDLAPLGAAPGSSARIKPLAFRLISASKAPLAESALRADLCERLAEGHLWRVPGLEERAEDIPGLARRFAQEQQKMLGAQVSLTPAAVRFCLGARWPGQIRQLRACITALAQLGLARALDAGGEPRIAISDRDLAEHLRERADAFGARAGLDRGERADERVPIKADARALTKEHIARALADADGNQARAARALGIARNTLKRKLDEAGLTPRRR
jgi:DNA-binding NtrC family response regulator